MSSSPKIWVFNYDFEFELARLPLQTKGAGNFLPWYFLNRFSPLLMPLCKEGDQIVSYEEPDPSILVLLKAKLGYKVDFVIKNELIETNSPLKNLLPSLLEYQSGGFSLRPWGWSPLAMKLEKKLKCKGFSPNLESVTRVNSKESSYLWRWRLLDEPFQIPSSIIKVNESSLEQLSKRIEEFCQKHSEFYIKHYFGTAGRLSDKINVPQVEGKKLNKYRQWITAVGGLLLEKSLDFEREWSLHVDIQSEGSVHFIGITKLLSKGDGSYWGSIVRNKASGLPKGIMNDLGPLFREIFATGYVGPIGMDLLQTSDREYKLIEINGRWTMGRIALEWNRAINRHPLGLFIQESFPRSRFPHSKDLIQFCQGLEKKLAIEITVINFVIAQGKNAKTWATLFIASNGEEEAMQVLKLIKGSS